MWEKIKGAGAGVLSLGSIVVIFILMSLFIQGGAWFIEKVYPWLASISVLAVAVALFLLLPLSFIRRTQAFTAGGFLITSYILGFTLWVSGLLLTYDLWGAFAVFLGIFLLGVGVVPIAMLATAFNGMWGLEGLGGLIVHTVFVFGFRAYSIYVASKTE